MCFGHLRFLKFCLTLSWRIIISGTLLSSLWHKLNKFMSVYVDVQSILEQSGWLDVFKYQTSDCYFELLSFWWSTLVRFQPIEFVKQKWVFSLESFNCTTLWDSYFHLQELQKMQKWWRTTVFFCSSYWWHMRNLLS